LNPNDKTLNTGKGFVASVTNKTTFYLVNNDESARLTEYNDNFLVFGKGEVQFKIGTSTLLINVGRNYKSLNINRDKGSEILTG
jgi:mannose-6-phosphate isomerase-like protein (cupin superfamily)